MNPVKRQKRDPVTLQEYDSILKKQDVQIVTVNLMRNENNYGIQNLIDII